MLTAFDVVLTNMRQGVVLLSAELRVQLFNDRLLQMLQIPRIAIGADAKTIAGQMPIRDQSMIWLTHLSAETKSLHQEIVIGDTLVSMVTSPAGGGRWLIQCEDISALARVKKDIFDQSSLFDTALDNMRHGLCMFDANKNLMLCNAAYSRLYTLPAELTRPGTPLQQILDHRLTQGNAPANRETYFDVVVEAAMKGSTANQNIILLDGRVIKISHNPWAMADTSQPMKMSPTRCVPKSKSNIWLATTR
jgi:PAS domain-containing protein